MVLKITKSLQIVNIVWLKVIIYKFDKNDADLWSRARADFELRKTSKRIIKIRYNRELCDFYIDLIWEKMVIQESLPVRCRKFDGVHKDLNTTNISSNNAKAPRRSVAVEGCTVTTQNNRE
jgi:hypothetical protein